MSVRRSRQGRRPGAAARSDVGPRPFDIATKDLIEQDPAAWLQYAGLGTPHEVRVIDADLASVIAAADKVLRVEAPRPWLAHLELQSTHDPTLPSRLLQYTVLLQRRHGLPIRSLAILLRPEADGVDLTGSFELASSEGEPYLAFRYGVVRAWQQSVAAVLAGPLATLPLAPLAVDTAQDLPPVVARLGQRLREEAGPAEAGVLWTATYLLLGLRYSVEQVEQVLQGGRAMQDSATYQAILARGRTAGLQEGRTVGLQEGRAEEARRLVLRLGQKRFGPVPEGVREKLDRAADPEELEAYGERLLDATGWDDLVGSGEKRPA